MLTANKCLVIYTDIGAIQPDTFKGLKTMTDATLALVTITIGLILIGHVTDGKVKKSNTFKKSAYRPRYSRY